MAVCVSAIFMSTALRGGENKTTIFDGPCTKKDLPVRFAGLFRERRGDRQDRCAAFGQCPVQRGKAQVVAYRKAEATPRQIRQYRQLAGTIVARLAVALAASKIDVEHVDLVIARRDVAL